MSRLVINGGSPLSGEIEAHGAKNSVLPILAATVLSKGECIIHNCPDLSDVRATFKILEELGCKVEYRDNTAIVDSNDINGFCVSESLMRGMRSSVIFLGSMLARMGRAVICCPGGCEIGSRPIDLHLKAMSRLGVKINEEHGFMNCTLNKLKCTNIHLDFPSVGATENIMLLSTVSDGITYIHNAAREPEIVDLQNFLNKMGAKVYGAGTSLIAVEGVEELHGAEHTVIPDRIVASSYLIASAITGGDVYVKNAIVSHIKPVVSVLEECGCGICCENGVRLTAKGGIHSIDYIRTMPHPGFPTDVQAPLTALLSVAHGTSIVSENMFESRFKHISELCRMGADIKVDGHIAVIKGVPVLSGAKVEATDLRGAAALVIAGLNAEGTTEVTGLTHLDRGYENPEGNLRSLGADIKRV